MTDWRQLVDRWGAACAACDLAVCVGLASDARDGRPLPLLACPHRTGPFYPAETRCPLFRRPAGYAIHLARRREGDKGVGGGVHQTTTQKGNQRND